MRDKWENEEIGKSFSLHIIVLCPKKATRAKWEEVVVFKVMDISGHLKIKIK
jgi:hypothetical protein